MRRKPFLLSRKGRATEPKVSEAGAEAPKLFRAEGENALTVFVYDIIDDWWGFSVSEFATELARMGDVEQITVRINSPGGDAFAGLAMYNLLAQHPAEIIVKVDGLAASAASVIAMAGDDGKIGMGAGSELMIHYPWVLAIGNSKDLEEIAAQLKVMDEGFEEFYAEHSNLDQKTIAEMLRAETFLSAEEAVEKGFADEVIKKDSKEKAQALISPAKMALEAYKARQQLDRTPEEYGERAKLERRVASQRLSLARRKLQQAINQAA